VWLFVGPCFSQLLHNPKSIGISRHAGSYAGREWRLRWTEKAGTGFTLPGHQEAAAEVPNGKSGKILEFRKVG